MKNWFILNKSVSSENIYKQRASRQTKVCVLVVIPQINHTWQWYREVTYKNTTQHVYTWQINNRSSLEPEVLILYLNSPCFVHILNLFSYCYFFSFSFSQHNSLHIILYWVYLAWAGFKLATLEVIGIDCIGSHKPNCHTITTNFICFFSLNPAQARYTQYKIMW
jgi:hypothetical protein